MLNSFIRKITYFKTLRSVFPVRKLFKSTMIEEYDIVNSNEQLKEYINRRGVSEQDEAVTEYLANIKYPPVSDFQKGLEWFNVSESLFFANHLKGKIVLLDFFTYCCINCMHILPDLKDIENEFSIEDGLVVIGVHSAKFENEKLSRNILAAVQRHNIAHPVVNDSNSHMWKNCDVCCWPTLLLLGPNANPIVMLMGEGHKQELQLYIRNALTYYKNKNEISNHKLPLKSAYHLLPDLKGPLLFPGKITNYVDGKNKFETIAISDTGNNRILVVQNSGNVTHQIGGSKMGYKDGNIQEAQFNSPQGLVFQNSYTLYVADTENHAIRKIDLKNNYVSTVAGVGEQGQDYKGGKHGVHQEISSPWDVCLFKISDLNSNKDVVKDVLIIAMAGTHQIWALFLEDTLWWKNKKYTAGTCVCIAGSGCEENKNNHYPNIAGFAQPSGLALCEKTSQLFIADSESSSIRKLSLVDGKVSAVVGGDINPKNLFAFGDKDGKSYEAKLQHLLGLTMSKSKDVLFVADTYNHKIKKVDILSNTITSLDTLSYKFNEPVGLCFNEDNKLLYIADTNNHAIKILNLDDDSSVVKINNFNIKFDVINILKINKTNFNIISAKPILMNLNGGKLIVTINLNLTDKLSLTSEAPQNWVVDLPNASWSCVPNQGSNVLNVDIVFSTPSMEIGQDTDLDFMYNLVTCKEDTCLPKKFIIRQPIKFSKDAPSVLNCDLKASLGQFKVVIY